MDIYLLLPFCSSDYLKLKNKKRKETYLFPPVPIPKLLNTSTSMIARTATVTISGSQVVAIGVIASLVLFIVDAAVFDTPVEAANLSNTRTPTPKIMPTMTNSNTNWYNCPISILNYLLPLGDTHILAEKVFKFIVRYY
jgi:hypothetical protein